MALAVSAQTPVGTAAPTASLARRFGVPGAIASTMMALAAVSVGWISAASGLGFIPLVATLRDQPWATATAKIVFFIGAGWLLQVWLRLGHYLRTTESDADPAAVRRLLLWWALPLALGPVLFSRDVFSYIADSRLLPNGIDPYQYGTGVLHTFYTDGADAMWKAAPAPYGPAWIGLSTLVYWLTGATAVPALIAFRLIAVVGVVLIAIYLPRLARACGADVPMALWLGLLNPILVFHFVSAAHNDAIMAGLLVMGMALTMEGRPVLGVLVVTTAGAVKAPALVALAFVGLVWAGPGASWLTRALRWAQAAALAAATFTLINLASGVGWGWVSSLGTPGDVRTWLSPTTAMGMALGSLVQALGLGYHVPTVVSVARLLGEAVAVTVVGYLIVTGERRSPVRGLGLSLLAIVVFGPVVQPWYLMWGLLMLAAAGLAQREIRAAALGTVGFAVYSVANTGATVDGAGGTVGALADGYAVLTSIAIVLVLLVASRTTRSLLLDDGLPDQRGTTDLSVSGAADRAGAVEPATAADATAADAG